MSLRGIGVFFDIVDFERFGSAFSRYKELDREGPFWREEAGKKGSCREHGQQHLEQLLEYILGYFGLQVGV